MDTTTQAVGTPPRAERADGPPDGAVACPICRDATPVGRLSLRGIVALVGKHLKLERGLLRTLADLSLRPGAMLRAYFSGERRHRYVNPVTYLVLSTAASLLAFELYKPAFRVWVAGRIGVETQRQMPEGTALGAASDFAKAYIEAMFEVMQRTTFTSLALVLPVALLLWLLFRGPRLNLAEALAFALYSMGTGLFLHSVLITPLMVARQWDMAQVAGTGLYLAVPVLMGLGYFGRTIGNGLRLLLAVLGGFVVGVMAIYVVVGVVVALRLLGH